MTKVLKSVYGLTSTGPQTGSDGPDIFSAVGVPKTPEGTGTRNNLFLEWSLLGTGNGNREHVGLGSVCPPHETPGG